MRQLKQAPLLVLAAILAFPAQADPVSISDESLLKMVNNQVPSVARLRAGAMAAEAAKSSYDDAFSTEAYVSGIFEGTNERSLIEFSPVFSPTRGGMVGVRKNFKWGMALDSNISLDQRSATATSFSVDKGTTLIGTLNLSMDLWKDFLGRTSRARYREFENSSKKARLEEKINLHVFKINVRSLYWQLVANQESRKLTLELLKKAKVQAAQAKKRRANSVADDDEVARYESQVAERQANLVYLDYQRDGLEKSLKEMLPELSGKTIQLKKYDLDRTVNDVIACTKTISRQKSPPFRYTYYDDIIRAVEEVKSSQVQSNGAYNGVDLKLMTSVKTTGVDPGSSAAGTVGGAFDDLTGNDRLGYSVGFELTIPLDGSKSDTERAMILRDEFQADAEIKERRSKIYVTHRQLIQSINYLSQVVQLQKQNSAHLAKRLNGLQKKYQQARIDVSTLVNDQSAKLNADLAIIGTQTEVLRTLFEYLAVFSETPCSFNKS